MFRLLHALKLFFCDGFPWVCSRDFAHLVFLFMLFYVIMYCYHVCTQLVFVMGDGYQDHMDIFLSWPWDIFYYPESQVFCVRFEETL